MDSDRIEGAAKDVAGKVTEIAGDAVGHEKTRADGVGLQIEGKAQNLYGQAKDGARELGDRAEDALQQADDLADRAIAEGKRQAQRGADEFEDLVRERPGRAIIAALTTGFLVGLLFRKM